MRLKSSDADRTDFADRKLKNLYNPRNLRPTSPIYLFLALLVANAIILFSPDWFWLRFPAAVALTFVLPGWAWASALNWLDTDEVIERIVLVFGVASIISAIALLIALLLPGPFTETPNLIALNLATLTGLVWRLGLGKLGIGNWRLVNNQLPIPNYQSLHLPSRAVLLILLAIIAVAAFTRLTRLGYAEFHEDELENMRTIVRAYKGEEYAAFLDSKGPIHSLLPGALWYLNGWVNEGIARTPFVLASLMLVPLMFSLGRRISGGRDSVGLVAAGFVAVNGFFVALSRHVEIRTFLIFWGALAFWFAYRSYKENKGQFLLYIALILAMGLIGHPSVLFYLPVFGYIIWLKVRDNKLAGGKSWLWIMSATLLFVGLLALFYVPYLTDPQIGLVFQYYADERIGKSILYNRVDNLFVEDTIYTTRYHAPILVALLLWLLGRNFRQWGRRGGLILGCLSLVIISTVMFPTAWIVGSLNLAFTPYALLTLLVILLPKTTVEIKTLFFWFSAAFGGLLFLTQDTSNNIQMAYPAWFLLGSLALTDLWQCLSIKQAAWWMRPLKVAIILLFTLIFILIISYQFLLFDVPVTTYWQAKVDSVNQPDSIYNLLYGGLPRPRMPISNPRLGGWKAVGYLWQQGTLSGDFRSINESFAVPVWYTFQTPRSCYDDPQNYWVRNDWKGWPEEAEKVPAQGYTLTRVVLVDQQPMLLLYEKNAPSREPEVFDSERYRALFDRLVTPARMAQDENITHPASYNFGDKLLMRGYELSHTTAHLGDLIPVTVFWQASTLMDIRYRAFMHLVGPDGQRWGQHDDDPACRLLTTEMRPGQDSSRQFRLPVDPATPPGDYQIVFGLYDPATQARLPIWDNLAGQSPGDSVILGQVKIN